MVLQLNVICKVTNIHMRSKGILFFLLLCFLRRVLPQKYLLKFVVHGLLLIASGYFEEIIHDTHFRA